MKHKKHKHKHKKRGFFFIDFLIVIICLSVTAYSINRFRLDLFQTIKLYNVQPVGVITIKHNIVQRRIADRILWDRLAAQSPVYLGDLIHTAELSAATIDMQGQRIDLGENTLIRILPVTDSSGVLQIELVDGNLDVAAAEDGGGLQLNLKGRKVKISGGTALSAAVEKGNLTVQVDRGTAAFIEEGESREVSSGTMIVLDSEGAEKIQPAVVVTQSNADEDSPASSPVSFFLIEHATITPLEPPFEPEPEPEAKPEPKPEPPPVPKPVPVEFRLLSPPQRTRLPGLTALREQTVFRWEAAGEVRSSRFVLSRNSNPLRGRPAVEIANPGRTIRLNRLEEGTWYWTIEARGVNGLVGAAPPRQLQILPIPLLPAPGGRQPANGYRIDIEQLKTQRDIVFTWSAVQGANAYVFTLYEQTENERRQINRATVVNPAWMLEDISALNRGTFIWQVEAVNRNSKGVIEQRGNAGENTFIIDIPYPGQVHIENPGILYGD